MKRLCCGGVGVCRRSKSNLAAPWRVVVGGGGGLVIVVVVVVDEMG